MAIPETWRFFQLNVAGTAIRGVTNPKLGTGIEQVLLGGDGAIDRTFAGVRSVRPDFEFDTFSIATALGAAGLNGLVITHTDPITLWFARTGPTGIESGDVHMQLALESGVLVPTVVRGGQFAEATVHYQVFLTYDGTNLPWVVAGDQPLPGQQVNDEMFTLGPAKINGGDVNSLQSLEINFGTVVGVEGDSGHIFPTFAGVKDREAAVTLETLDISQLAALGITGAAQGETDSFFYLRRKTPDGALVADEDPQHVSFGVDAGHFAPGDVTEADNRLTMPITCAPRFDGTNDVFVINTATPIN